MRLESFRAGFKWAASALAMTAFVVGQGNAATVIYTSSSTYAAASTGNTSVTFTSQPFVASPPAYYYSVSNPYTVGAVTFSGEDSDYLETIPANFGSGHYGSDVVLTAQQTYGTYNGLLITFAAPVTSASILFNGFINNDGTFSNETVTVNLSNGTTATVPSTADGSYDFLGFTSTTPFTTIELTDPNSLDTANAAPDATLNLAVVQYGTSTVGSVTPEPSTLILTGNGLLGVVALVRRRSKK